MKKILVLLYAFVFLNVFAQEEGDFRQIRESWMNSRIDVPKGGNAPGVIKLLSAFQKHWPTWMGEQIVEKASMPGFVSYESPEQLWYVEYQREYNYVFINSPENDAGSMHAVALPRKDGHTLLCVIIGVPLDEGDDIACYYDYDPSGPYMSPCDGGPDTGYRKMFVGSQTSVTLPCGEEKFSYQEYFERDMDDTQIFFSVRHFYDWNGEEFVFDHTEITSLEEMEEQYDEVWQKSNPGGGQHPQFCKVALFDVDNDEVPEVFLSDENRSCQAVYTLITGTPVMTAWGDERRPIAPVRSVAGGKGKARSERNKPASLEALTPDYRHFR